MNAAFMNVNMRQLRSLVAIARLGSFTRAAQALHVSQPALTVQIHQLEGVLGARLLDRNTRSVRLTQLGQQVVPIIERALGDIDKAMAGTRLSLDSVGVVTVAALPSLCASILPAAIARFSGQHPGIVVRLRETGAIRIAHCVLDGEADFGIGTLERTMPQLEPDPFMTDRLAVVCPANHPLATRRRVLLGDILEYPLIALDALNTVRATLDRALHELGRPITAIHEVSYISTAIGMVRAGLGITVVSTSALGRAVMTGLRARFIDHPGLDRDIVILRRKSQTLSPAAAALLATIRQVRDSAPGQEVEMVKPGRRRGPVRSHPVRA